MSERGRYIVIEGSDGTGKSTQVDILQNRLHEVGINSIQIHEPDGFEGNESLGIPSVPEAIELRKRVKDASFERTPWQNVEMFTRARELNWQQAMNPALKLGIWVLAARSWISTVTYQGYGQGVDIDKIRAITTERVGDKYLKPDLTLILTLEDEQARFNRIAERGALETPDTFESLPDEFQQAMQQGYVRYAHDFGIPTIDASTDKLKVSDEIWQYVHPFITRQDSK